MEAEAEIRVSPETNRTPNLKVPKVRVKVRGVDPAIPMGPPSNACSVHWKFGKSAWLCADRHNCPWRDFENPRPRHNRNIAATERKEDDSD